MRPRPALALWAALLAVTLAGCSRKMEEAPAPVAADPSAESCAAPGDDDGIGGTGCTVD